MTTIWQTNYLQICYGCILCLSCQQSYILCHHIDLYMFAELIHFKLIQQYTLEAISTLVEIITHILWLNSTVGRYCKTSEICYLSVICTTDRQMTDFEPKICHLSVICRNDRHMTDFWIIFSHFFLNNILKYIKILCEMLCAIFWTKWQTHDIFHATDMNYQAIDMSFQSKLTCKGDGYDYDYDYD